MPRVRDSKNREWELRVTLGSLAPLREAGFDVSDAVSDPKSITRLRDLDLFGRVLWILCSEQAAARSISPEEFAAGFDGPTIFAAADALGEALLDFCHRPEVAKLLKETLRGAMETMTAAALAEIHAGSKTPVGSSPESSASTADPSPSVNSS